MCIVDTEHILYLDIRHTVHDVHIVHTCMHVHIYIYTFIYSCILPTVYSLLHAAYCIWYVAVVFVCTSNSNLGVLTSIVDTDTSSSGHNVHIMYMCIVDTEHILYSDTQHAMHNVHTVHTDIYIHIYIHIIQL